MLKFETAPFSKQALFWGAPVHSIQNIFMREDQDLCKHQNENKRKRTRANTKTQIILKMPVSIAFNNPTRRSMRTQN